MKFHRYLSLLSPILFTGCVAVTVHPGDVALTNAALGDMYANRGRSIQRAQVQGFRFDDSEINTSFGKLHYVLAQSDPTRPLIVFCGGNAFIADKAGGARLEALAPFGDVLFFDYPGLGRSAGTNAIADYKAAEAAILSKTEALMTERHADRVIFWGHSLGGQICASLASESKGKSDLVVESSFANIHDVADSVAGMAAPLINLKITPDTLQYDVPALLKGYPGTITVVASKADTVIRYGVTQRLVRRLRAEGKTVTFITLQTSEHSTPFTDPDYRPKLQQALMAAHVSAP